MVRTLRFPGPLAEIMNEYVAETVGLSGDPAGNYTAWCFPAAGIVSRMTA